MRAPKAPATWFFLASLALSIAVVWDLIVPLSLGAVLAFVSERPIDAAARRLGKEGRVGFRWLLSIGFVLLVFAVLFVPLGIALYIALRDVAHIVASKHLDEWARVLYHVLEVVSARLAKYGIDVAPGELSTRARAFVTENAGKAGSVAAAALSATPNAVFNLTVTLLAWIFLAVEGREARQRILVRVIPWARVRETICEVTAEVVQGTIVANVLVSFVQALVLSIVLIVFRVPRAFVWGVLTFFFSFVPVIGTAPITLGAAAWLVSQGRPVAAVAMLVVAFLVAGLDNVLRPLFFRTSIELNFLWVLVALVGGVAVFGLAGVILGPLAFSLLVASLRSLEELDNPAAAAARRSSRPPPSRPSMPPPASIPPPASVPRSIPPPEPIRPSTPPPNSVPPSARPPSSSPPSARHPSSDDAKSPEPKTAEPSQAKISEQNASEQKTAEPNASELKTAEPNASEPKASEQKVSEQKASAKATE